MAEKYKLVDGLEITPIFNMDIAILFSTNHNPDYLDKYRKHLAKKKHCIWDVGFKVKKAQFKFPLSAYLHLTRRGIKYKIIIDDIKPYNPSWRLDPSYKDITLPEKQREKDNRRWKTTFMFSKVQELPKFIPVTSMKKTDGNFVKRAPQNYVRIIKECGTVSL